MFQTQYSQSNFGIFNKPSTSQSTFGFNQPQQSTFGAFGAVKPPEQQQLPTFGAFGAVKPPEQQQLPTFGAFGAVKPPEQQQLPTFGAFGAVKPPEQQPTFGAVKTPENLELKLQELNNKMDGILALLNKQQLEKATEKIVEKKYAVSPIHNHPLLETTRDKQCLSYTNGFTCYICGYTHKEEYFYHCEECYKGNPQKLFDVCGNCIKKQFGQ
jgi:hypothetical protein